MLESRAERSALGAAPYTAVVDFGLILPSPEIELLNHTGKKNNDANSIPAQEAYFNFARKVFIFVT